MQDIVESPLLVDAYRYVRHVWIVALTLCLYDYALMFKSESKFVWRGAVAWPKAVFLANRYYAIFYLIFGNLVMALTPASNTKLCHAWFKAYIDCAFPMFITFFSINLARLHAAFNRDRRLMIAAGVFYCGVLLVMFSLLAYFSSQFKVVLLPPTWTGCIPLNTIAYSWALFMLLGLSEVALLAVLLTKAVQILRQGYKPVPVLVIILRDTALYSVFTAACIVFDISQTGGMESIFVAWPPLLVALLSTMGSRMLLNIHQAVEDAGERWRSPEFTSVQLRSLQFARGAAVSDSTDGSFA